MGPFLKSEWCQKTDRIGGGRFGTNKLNTLARTFERLRDGEMAAVVDRGGLRHFFNFKRHRYWELVSCTTQGASRDQFDRGSGWWRHIECHPSCTDPAERARRR